MRIAQEKVELFMQRIGDTVNEKPTLVDPASAFRRHKFILEELTEYDRAVSNNDLAGIADAGGDLLYVVLGLFALHGIDAQSVFDEVHRSNMTKTPSQFGSEKRCVKGPDFQPPRLAEILLMQASGLMDEVV